MKKLHDLLFGMWQEKSIKKIVDFEQPGAYLLKARAFGFKGLVGGTHSWIVHLNKDGSQIVAEVTDLASLRVQGATLTDSPRVPSSDDEKLVIISNREGGQKWFGAIPIVTYLGEVNQSELITWIKNYPLINDHFRTLDRNCNTFSSWIVYKMGLKKKGIGIGAKGKMKWKLLD